MRILHIATHLNTGGITTYLLTLASEQVKAGHEVYVWASQGEHLEAFKACCTRVIYDVPRCKSELSPRLWARLPKLVKFLRQNSIEVIHTHTRVAQVLAAAATCFVKVPYVSTAHMFYKRRLGRRLFPCWGRAVVAISETMRKGLSDIFGEKNLPPVVVVRNGIDIEKFRSRIDRTDRDAVRKALGYTERHFVVLALSRLIPVKGIHILIDAFAIAYQQVPEMRLLLAGAGDDAYVKKLKDQVSALNLNEAVRFLGNVTEVEKPLKAADIFVGPYLWPEAFGLSILEAMIAGLPVVGSDSGGITGLLGDGSCGLLFRKDDASELARCLLNYAKDPGLRAKMGKAAGRAALDYSAKKMSEQIQKVYEGAIGRQR